MKPIPVNLVGEGVRLNGRRHAKPGAAPVVRKPVPKAYGAGASYGETKYERERRERRERGAS